MLSGLDVRHHWISTETKQCMKLINDGLQRLTEQRSFNVAAELRVVGVHQPLETRQRLRSQVVSLASTDTIATSVGTAQRFIHTAINQLLCTS
jgi:hypothetical protein